MSHAPPRDAVFTVVIEAWLQEDRRSNGASGSGPSCDAVEIQKALFSSARALLVVRGSDPKRPEEAVLDFLQKFISPGISSAEFAGLNDVHESVAFTPAEATRQDAAAYARRVLQHIGELYKRMDPPFNFPTAEAKTTR
jgi:hypothetical protein